MRICLDTNTYSELKRNNAFVLKMLEEADTIIVPAVVLGELYTGFLRGLHNARNFNELEDFLALPGVEVLPVHPGVALRYAKIMKELFAKGKPIPTNDVWIAASALVSDSNLLTLDDHFRLVPGLTVIGKNGDFG